MKHTKIVATVADRRCDADFIKRLADAGVNVVRMNSAHLDADGMRHICEVVREAAPSVALMIDTKGPEIRTTVLEGGVDFIAFSTGDCVEIVGNPGGVTSGRRICLNFEDIARYVVVGNRLLIDDGELAFRVTGVDGGVIQAVAENAGKLGSRKSVNIPGVSLPLPAVTPRDRACIVAAADLGVDFVAHSFVRSAADIAAVREILDSLGSQMKIIAKIENQEGVDNFDEILRASYGIMIARGDLGIEVAIETLPGIQQRMINKCIAAHRPVIVATQMLQSMIEHPRPTRAEVSDVAGAVYQRADAMMLSGETASGKYPVEAVQIMARVAAEVERELSKNPDIHPMPDREVASYLARQAVVAESKVGVKAIITDAFHGASARYIASYRAATPVIALCYNRSVARWLALSYGIEPEMLPDECTSQSSAFKALVEAGRVDAHQLVAYLSGTSHGITSLQIDTPAHLIG